MRSKMSTISRTKDESKSNEMMVVLVWDFEKIMNDLGIELTKISSQLDPLNTNSSDCLSNPRTSF